jgi:predicted dehydrogenase
MPKAVRLGVAGAGSIGLRAPLAHISVGDVSDKVVLAAVCDPVPGRAKAAAEKFRVPEHFEDYGEMIKKADIDAVTLCSPIGVHFEQGMQAVKAGKHIHFNKTMTTTRAEADKLIEAARKARVKLVASPGQMLRPDNLRIRKLIEDGAIGKMAWGAAGAGFGTYHEEEGVRQGSDVLSNVDPTWYFRKPGGGPLYDMTVYGLHSLTGVLGPAKKVTAMSGVLLREREFKGRMVPSDTDDNTLILLDFGKTLFAFVYGAATGGLVPFGLANYYGTKGSIVGDAMNGKPIDYPGRDKRKPGEGMAFLPHVTGAHAKMEEAHVYEDVMQLVDWIREGIPSVASAEHARHVIEIFEAAYRSAATGKAQVLKSTFAPPPGR